MRKSNAGLFWSVLVLVFAADVLTKALAEHRLPPLRLRHEVFGDWVSFTLIHNAGAAFGLNVGQYSRWVFIALTLLALVILGRLYVSTRPGDTARVTSLALVCGGAVGNLLDRLRSANGVVDFIDVGFSDARWPTFNIADVAVSVGAILLAWVLWMEDRQTLGVTAAHAVSGETGELS